MRRPFPAATRRAGLVLALALAGASTACSLPTSPSGATSVAAASPASPQASGSATPSATASTAPAAHETPSKGGVTFAPTGTGRLDGKTIVLDPGHNAHYVKNVNNVRMPMYGTVGGRCQSAGGAANDKRIEEHALVWKVAQKALPQLLVEGATVILTRPDDDGTGPCNSERADMANRSNADFLLSIHSDGSENPKNRGYFTLVPGHSAGGEALLNADKTAAKVMNAELGKHTSIPLTNYIGLKDGGVVSEDVAVLNNLTKTRGLLVEIGNLNQADDLAVINSDAGQQKLADGLVAGTVAIVAGA